jgi:hypothetical protein
MAAELERTLLEHRLIIVTGKGGTGKTTIAACLGLAAASQGMRAVLAEVGHAEHLPKLFSDGGEVVGYEGRELLPGLTVMRIDPFEALTDYLGLQLGVRAPVRAVFKSRAFRQFLQATPGWRELIMLGRVWHLEQMKNDAGAPLYDTLIVDAPATGHGLTFLDVPHVVASAVQSGPLRRNALEVEALIRDASRTLLLPVALAEELPARETVELIGRVREDIGVAVDRVVINAIAPPPFPPGLEELDAMLAKLPPDRPTLHALPPPASLSACATLLASRYRLNQGYVEQIGVETGLPIIPLPYLDGGLRGIADLRLLGAALTADVAGPTLYTSAAALEATRAGTAVTR